MTASFIAALKPVTSRVRTDVSVAKSGGKTRRTDEPLTDELLAQHLNGGTACGVYTIKEGESSTMIVVLDLDSHKGETTWEEMVSVAQKVVFALKCVGLQPIGFRSSGGHGIHLYLLWDEPQDAYSVREFLVKQIGECGYTNGTSGVKNQQIEIFPKQNQVETGRYGSQVFLPLAGNSVPLDMANGLSLMPRDAILALEWPLSKPVPLLNRPFPSLRSKRSALVEANYALWREQIKFLDPDECSYEDWLRIGMALHYETNGALEGLELWDMWSSGELRNDGETGSAKYLSYSDLEHRWNGFKINLQKPVTQDTIAKLARKAGWGKISAEEEFPAVQKPIIEVRGGDLSEEATKGENALIQAGAPIYQRDGFLVHLVPSEVEVSNGKRTKVAQLVRVDRAYLIDKLCKYASWEKYDARSSRMKRINSPSNIATTIESRFGDWKFPKVIGVINTPTLRPDGSILSVTGYDLPTLLLLSEPPPMPTIPEYPTKGQAYDALNLLKDLIEEFPFADDASESVALSAMITPVVRGAFTVSPMHAVTAPMPGSGKSFLFDICSVIATGQVCPVMAAGANEEETEKRLGAALMAGQSIISIDNFNGDLGGDALCQIIERPIVDIRILGKSERARIESRSTIFATGNNLRLVGDLTRRVIICRLDAKSERPELRAFKRNPLEDIFANRGLYVAAALTVVRAYFAAGKPNPAPPLGSFGGWSDTVRSALMWLECADPVQTMEAARREDPTLQATIAVFTAWRDTIGIGKKLTAAELINQATTAHATQEFCQTENSLQAALIDAIGSKSGSLNARELGKWLSRQKERIVCDLRLEGKTDSHGHAAQWWLTNVAVEAIKSGCLETQVKKCHSSVIDDLW